LLDVFVAAIDWLLSSCITTFCGCRLAMILNGI
jgi:hypothetical protein